MTDQGVGIPVEDRPYLFEPFFKTKNEENRRLNKESHGLGLNICARIAENLGGELTLNEELE